jgi:hypothetical protein
MHDDLRFTEDIPLLAAEAFDLANRLCGSCRNFHSLWPFLRIAGASGGDVDVPPVHSAITDAISGNRQRLLIAGAADSGLLAVVARATRGAKIDIVVLDRCATPLELCRRFAQRWLLPIKTMQTDLGDFSSQANFDAVFTHSILQFIGDDRQLDVLQRLRRGLRLNGRLVIVFRTSERIEESLMPEYRENYPKRLLDQLDEMNIPLPEPRDAFRRRVQMYAAERLQREGAHADSSQVEKLINAAGFALQSITAIRSELSAPFRAFTDKISKRRFLAVARPR